MMSYQLDPDKKLDQEVRRVTQEQLEKAVDSLDHRNVDLAEAVHDVRKRLKKIRAVIRLVRDELGGEAYREENTFFRDLGRRLSDLRDSWVRVETVTQLETGFEEILDDGALRPVRRRLLARHKRLLRKMRREQAVFEEVRAELVRSRQRVEEWDIGSGEDAFERVRPSLRRVYKRGRKALCKAQKDPTSENLHEWRKRAKYLWNHLRLLKPLWPEVLSATGEEIHILTSYLGDDHDLAELEHSLRRAEVAPGDELSEPEESAMQALWGLSCRRRLELQEKAWPLGHRIYAEEPDDFVNRIGGYWNAVRQMKLAA